MPKARKILAGVRHPAGATWLDGGVNFSIYSPGTTEAELILYTDEPDDGAPEVYPLASDPHRSFLSWHVFVPDVAEGTRYQWRLRSGSGPWQTILDPWSRAVDDARWDRAATARGAAPGLRGIVLRPPPVPNEQVPPKSLDGAIIYELHVGGFTSNPNSKVTKPGTFQGVIEKIPHLKALGITHVELLPVMAFDEQDVPDNLRALDLKNFWGYSPYAFYAPHPRYCATDHPAREFRAMVDALHENGIGVIVDVVYNHTSEGGSGGPVIHFKAMAGQAFYHIGPNGSYRDYTGCGNTINCNHPLVALFLVRCLEYWAHDLGVDGFRFDLASVFSRGENGEPMANPPLPWNIELSRALIDSPMIAEAWDAAGLYQVGTFPGSRWAEWNGAYRDVMRRFVRGDGGLLGEVASCLAGSSQLYADDGRPPSCSVNFITCHDGFTLRDLVSYNEKHNEGNGEFNRDGNSNNMSWNCGVEGPTTNPAIRELRARQTRNLVTLLMLSQGTPMLLAGDEFLRSQSGNNNAWCQDNPLGWIDWEPDEEGREMFGFLSGLIAIRRRHACFRPHRHLTGESVGPGGRPDITWHDPRGNKPDWSVGWARFLGFTLAARGEGEPDIHAMVNMSDHEIPVTPVASPGGEWRLVIDTSGRKGATIFPAGEGPTPGRGPVAVPARTILVWESEPMR